MAITGFGVTELNLIGASGTPKIESPNNLNLDAVNVAISTNATVGGTLTVAGNVDIADTIYHTGDSNTKIRFPVNDTITFHTGGNEQFRIDSVGNVGVGTIAPTTKLDVRGGVNVTGVSTFNNDVQFKGALYNSLWDEATSKFKLYDLAQIAFGDGNDLQIYSDGTYGIIKGNDTTKITGITQLGVSGLSTFSGNVGISTDLNVSGISTFNNDVSFKGAGSNAKWDQSSSDLTLYDDTRLIFGDNTDFQIWHGGSHTFLRNSGGELRIRANSLLLKNQDDDEKYIECNSNGSVDVYFNDNKKFETTNHGTVTTGISTATGFRSSTTDGDGSDVAFATKYYITANGSSAYRFAGAGITSATDNPTLYFHRGFTYILENSTGGSHPFALRVSDGGSAYAPGGQFLTGSTTGTQVLTVPMDAPVSIVYQCTSHAGMVGIITFVK